MTPKVLVVDDQAEVAEFFLELVRLVGYEGEFQSDPSAALELIAEREFDLVVSDFRMPELSGFEFYQRAIEIRPELATRFVFLTGDLFNDETAVAMASTGAPFIAKPFRLADVQRVLDSVAAKNVGCVYLC